MKATISKLLIIFILLSSVFTIGAAPAHHLVKTPFTGTMTLVAIPWPNPGTITVVGDKTIYKDFVQYMHDESTDPRVRGELKVVLFFVQDNATGAGPFWGNNKLTNDSGSWIIHGFGYINADGTAWARDWGYGTGAYQGMTAYWEHTSTNGMFSTTFSGYILEFK